jgi:phosphopantothenoylcysteine decarboxylase/phosphopantothenate--cysteine ligase
MNTCVDHGKNGASIAPESAAPHPATVTIPCDAMSSADDRQPSAAARRVLITAGPTHEPIDAVRYIGNRSSGRLGLALARAAADVNMEVTLLLGPIGSSPDLPGTVAIHSFQTTGDLQALLETHWPDHNILIMAAAVADYRPVTSNPDSKIRRTDATLTLTLEPTPDLLEGLATRTRPDQIIIGFALEEPANLESSARRKMTAKRLDAIVANPLQTMNSQDITATVYCANGTILRPAHGLAKTAFARWLIGQLPEICSFRG